MAGPTTKPQSSFQGNVSDHELFGEGNENYKANSRLQRPATAKALLEGRWPVFEGQYFNCWDERRGIIRKDGGSFAIQDPDMRMMFSRKDIGVAVKEKFFPEGWIYVLDEVVRPGILAGAFAELLVDRWLLQNGRVPDPPRSLQGWRFHPTHGLAAGSGASTVNRRSTSL